MSSNLPGFLPLLLPTTFFIIFHLSFEQRETEARRTRVPVLRLHSTKGERIPGGGTISSARFATFARNSRHFYLRSRSFRVYRSERFQRYSGLQSKFH